MLISELAPRAFLKAFGESALDSDQNTGSYTERVKGVLSLVENGNSEVVDAFVTALKELGNVDILELIYPPDICNRAGKGIFFVYIYH